MRLSGSTAGLTRFGLMVLVFFTATGAVAAAELTVSLTVVVPERVGERAGVLHQAATVRFRHPWVLI